MQITDEQKAHDLSVAYATYLAISQGKDIDVEPFYQYYSSAMNVFLRLVKRNN